MHYESLPRAHNYLSEYEILHLTDATTLYLTNTVKEAGLDPQGITSMVDLGCGKGNMVNGALHAFPQAVVYAVDYYDDLLISPLRNNPRVRFHQGLMVDVLAAKQIPACDITLISAVEQNHGFNREKLPALVSVVKGILVTTGDNGNLERRSWFLESFSLVHTRRDGAKIWRVLHSF